MTEYRCGRCGKVQAPSPAELCPICKETVRKRAASLARIARKRKKKKP